MYPYESNKPKKLRNCIRFLYSYNIDYCFNFMLRGVCIYIYIEVELYNISYIVYDIYTTQRRHLERDNLGIFTLV